MTVKVLSPSPDYAVRVLDMQGNPRLLANIVVTLQGPKNQIDKIYQQSQNATAPDDDFSSLTFVPPMGSVQNRQGAAGEDNSVDTLGISQQFAVFSGSGA